MRTTPISLFIQRHSRLMLSTVIINAVGPTFPLPARAPVALSRGPISTVTGGSGLFKFECCLACYKEGRKCFI